MRISMVIPSFYPATVYGGTIFSSLHTVKSLVARGHEVWVSTTNTNMHGKLDVPVNQFTEMEPGLMVKYYDETIVDKFSYALYKGLREDLEKADVVHVQAIFNTPVPRALSLARRLDKPTLLSPRGVLGEWIMGQGNPLKRMWLKQLIAPHVPRIRWHATSQQESDEIRSHFPDANISEIPNGVDLSTFQEPEYMDAAAFHKAFGGPHAATPSVRIVSMGRIHRKKGFDILIKSFQQLLETHPDAHLYIAGQNEGAQSDAIPADQIV
ncbi:MAG: glycosyltransferase, partial [Bacteroidota bacterium]